MKSFNCFYFWVIFTLFLISCGGGSGSKKDNSALSLGCRLDQKEFDKTDVFEPLAAELPENDNPNAVSLLEFAPKRLSQGKKGSCTSWAACYAAGTILWAQARDTDPNSIAFSPDFIYNQMTRGNCTGTNISEALQKIVDEGLVGLDLFPYSDEDCDRQPSNDIQQKGLENRLKGFNRLTLSGDDYKVDIEAIKQNLNQGAPVVIGMAVGGTFYDVVDGVDMWIPSDDDYKSVRGGKDGHIVDDGGMSSFGGHAMCVIGYDDNKDGGCFQIMNSWGADWGADGIFWMRYKDFEFFVNEFYGEAYGLFPLTKKKKSSDSDFEATIGLLINKSDNYIDFQHSDNFTFSTSEQMSTGTKFKIAVRNETECYTYVFGQETDGSSYVLFPYTEKHSAYCGITGTRLFPKDYSLQLDDIGSKDVMVILFSKKMLDYEALNQEITNAPGNTYEKKIRNALGDELIENVKYNDGEKISFKANSEGKNVVMIVFEIDK